MVGHDGSTAPVAHAPTRVSGPGDDLLWCRWDATFVGAHRIVPDGCVELMWLEGRGLVVCGPDTTAWTFDLASPRRAGGVRIRPGMAEGLLGVDLASLRDRVVDLDRVIDPRAVRRAQGRIESGGTVSRALVALALGLGATRHRVQPSIPLGLALRPTAELSSTLGFSERQLLRRCERAYGYPPSVLRAVLRLQYALQLQAQVRGQRTTLAHLAAAAGYADQSHLAVMSVGWPGSSPASCSAPRWPLGTARPPSNWNPELGSVWPRWLQVRAVRPRPV